MFQMKIGPILTFFAMLANTKAAYSAEKSLPQLDYSTYASQVFWLTLTFVTLYFFLTSVVIPKLGGIIEERQAKIKNDLDEAQKLQKEAESTQKKYENFISETQKKVITQSLKLREKLKDELDAKKQELHNAVEKQYSKISLDMKEKEKETQKLIRETTVNLTDIIVEKFLGKSINESEFKQYLKENNE